MEVLSKYDTCMAVKQEITEYISMLNRNRQLNNEQNLRGIVKRILFLKTICNSSDDGHYKNFMIYDLLTLMHALTLDSKRNFYNTYRSLIENFIRFMLELPDFDETGVRNLFTQFKDKFSNDNTKNIIVYIEGEYGKCCDYVHSNIRAQLVIAQYYDDILKTDEMNLAKITSFIGELLTFMQQITVLMIYVSPESIERAFYRRKQELKYLIGDSNYTLFLQNID